MLGQLLIQSFVLVSDPLSNHDFDHDKLVARLVRLRIEDSLAAQSQLDAAGCPRRCCAYEIRAEVRLQAEINKTQLC